MDGAKFESDENYKREQQMFLLLKGIQLQKKHQLFCYFLLLKLYQWQFFMHVSFH